MSIPLLVIADDNPMYLAMMTELLTEARFSELHCVTNRHALSAIQQYQPGLLLLNLNAANACATWNMLYRMWFTPAAHYIPVLVCTTEPRLIRQKAVVLRAHGCTLLEKRFERDVLVDMIYPLLGTPLYRIHAISKEDWMGGTQLIPVGFLFLIVHHSHRVE